MFDLQMKILNGDKTNEKNRRLFDCLWSVRKLSWNIKAKENLQSTLDAGKATTDKSFEKCVSRVVVIPSRQHSIAIAAVRFRFLRAASHFFSISITPINSIINFSGGSVARIQFPVISHAIRSPTSQPDAAAAPRCLDELCFAWRVAPTPANGR